MQETSETISFCNFRFIFCSFAHFWHSLGGAHQKQNCAAHLIVLNFLSPNTVQHPFCWYFLSQALPLLYTKFQYIYRRLSDRTACGRDDNLLCNLNENRTEGESNWDDAEAWAYPHSFVVRPHQPINAGWKIQTFFILSKCWVDYNFITMWIIVVFVIWEWNGSAIMPMWQSWQIPSGEEVEKVLATMVVMSGGLDGVWAKWKLPKTIFLSDWFVFGCLGRSVLLAANL